MTQASPAGGRVRVGSGWLFGGSVPLPGPEDRLDPVVVAEFSRSDLDDSGWEPVSVPHTVVPLSWRLWDAASWEKVWAYRAHLPFRPAPGTRVFLDFDGAVTSATVTFNEVLLGEHRGGYLPFSFEVTGLIRESGDNVLAVILDSRFNINTPPNITSAAPSTSVDYWQPGGLHRDVWIRTVPTAFVRDVALTHHDVLDPDARSTTVVVTVDSTSEISDVDIVAELIDEEVSASTVAHISALSRGVTRVELELADLERVQLWDVDEPHLYDLSVSIRSRGAELHRGHRRTGYREARFEIDGFFLNGIRRYLMGVNRHGLFPFAGFSMPDRVQRRDAEIIRHELNCVMVRCAHYPQSPAFLDACDELGLLVWEESPGWQHVGDSEWQDAAARDIAEMIARDRHRPSIVVWGARLNETPDRPVFYARTEALVKELDPTRATSGTMHGEYSRTATFQHDVFSFDDYHTSADDAGDHRPILLPPFGDRPYLVSEAVSTRSSPTTLYNRAQDSAVQQHQALDYANAHNDARGDARFCGLLAWVAFDYQSATNNHFQGTKTSGLADTFRVLKPGAALYRAQVPPTARVVLEPAFCWDSPERSRAIGYADRVPRSAGWGPGARAMICSNCDRIRVFLDDEIIAEEYPDKKRFPHLIYPPTFVDLSTAVPGSELRLAGLLDGEEAVSRRFASDRSRDVLAVSPDDAALSADGVDATRVVIAVVDEFGNLRSSSRAWIDVEISGPGKLLGDERFDLTATGGVAAIWVRSLRDSRGIITVRAHASGFGMSSGTILAVDDPG